MTEEVKSAVEGMAKAFEEFKATNDDRLSQLEKKGATDEMIKEMIDVVGMANQNNKLVEAYQVEVDDIYK